MSLQSLDVADIVLKTIESDVGFLPDGEAYAFSYGDCLGPKGEEIVQSEQVFWQGVQHHILKQAERNHDIVVGELGFGAGLNFMATWLGFERAKMNVPHLGCLRYVSFEIAPMKELLLRRIHDKVLAHLDEPCRRQQYIKKAKKLRTLPFTNSGIVRHQVAEDVLLYLVLGDVRDSLPSIDFYHFDAWYLSGYAPRCNSEMYSRTVLQQIAQKSQQNTPVVTYSVANEVVSGLQAIGANVTKVSTRNLKKKQCLRAIVPAPKKICTKSYKQKRDTVTVIGGGIAGLTCLYVFHHAGVKVHCIDDCADNTASKIPTAQVTRGIPDLQQPVGALRFLAFDVAKKFYEENSNESILSRGSLHILDGFRSRQITKRASQKLWQNAHMRIYDSDLASSLARVPIQSKALYARDSLHLSVQNIMKNLHALPIINKKVTTIRKTSTHWKIFSGDEVILEASHIILAPGNGIGSLLQQFDQLFPFKRKLIPQQSVLFSIPTFAHIQPLTQTVMGSVYLSARWQGNNKELYHTLGARSAGIHSDVNYDMLCKRLQNSFLKVYDQQMSGCDFGKPFQSMKLTTADRLPICGKLYGDANKTLWALGALGGHGYTLAPLLAEVLLENFLGGFPLLYQQIEKMMQAE